MGSDPIALPALEAMRSGSCGAIDIVAIYTQPDRPRGRGKRVQPNEIKLWAQASGLPVLQPDRLGKAERLELAALQPDSVLVMAYGHLLSQALLDTPCFGIWNLHTSILPRYRGASPIQCAIASGDAETGVSLMRLVKEMDAGPVLDVERVRIGELDTSLEIEGQLAEACVPLLRRGLPLVHAGAARPAEQNASAASYVRKLGKDDGELDFRVAADALARRINGLYPWPGARFPLGEMMIKVGLAASQDLDAIHPQPGLVLGESEQGLRIACGRGAVVLKRLQRPGGKMLDAPEFARGFSIPEGTVLESRSMPTLVSDRPFQA